MILIKLLLLWNFFNILNRAAIYIDHYLAGGYLISSAYSLFSYDFLLLLILLLLIACPYHAFHEDHSRRLG